MSIKEVTTPEKINFHFDPRCPLAWRTALWVRKAREVRPVQVEWRLFSLEIVNRKEGAETDYIDGGWAALRTLALARTKEGNEGIERLYIALGNAQHGRKEPIKELSVLEACALEAGFDANFVKIALEDRRTIHDVLADHEEAVTRYHAFGVPTIALEDSTVGFYGPIIRTVPEGEAAGELWDYTSWALHQPDLFELKRDRAQASWGPVSA
jgi:predicted DsbA family dithiol-disulfide isomerase